jgi:hypothetical protein
MNGIRCHLHATRAELRHDLGRAAVCWCAAMIARITPILLVGRATLRGGSRRATLMTLCRECAGVLLGLALLAEGSTLADGAGFRRSPLDVLGRAL